MEKDEPGSELGLMFSRVETFYSRMGPLISGKKDCISLALVYISWMLLLLRDQWNLWSSPGFSCLCGPEMFGDIREQCFAARVPRFANWFILMSWYDPAESLWAMLFPTDICVCPSFSHRHCFSARKKSNRFKVPILLYLLFFYCVHHPATVQDIL